MSSSPEKKRLRRELDDLAASHPPKDERASGLATNESEDMFDMFATRPISKSNPSIDSASVPVNVSFRSGRVVSSAPVIHEELTAYRVTVGSLVKHPSGRGEFRVEHIYGSGVFGTVVRATYHSFTSSRDGIVASDAPQRVPLVPPDGATVALKISRSVPDVVAATEREARHLLTVTVGSPAAPNHVGPSPSRDGPIVTLVSAPFRIASPTGQIHFAIPMEAVEGGSLKDIIASSGVDVPPGGAAPGAGAPRGVSLAALGSLATALVTALSLLHDMFGIVHGDVKPDNILVSLRTLTVKLADFGTSYPVPLGIGASADEGGGPPIAGPYFMARWYRAPEVVVGAMPYGAAVDMWGCGVSLFEAYTGVPLFPASSSNDLAYRMLQLFGPWSKKLLRRGTVSFKNFTSDGAYLIRRTSVNGVSSTTQVPNVAGVPPTDSASLRAKLRAAAASDPTAAGSEGVRFLNAFEDFVSKCLRLDPLARLTAKEAASHDFIRGAEIFARIRGRVGVA